MKSSPSILEVIAEISGKNNPGVSAIPTLIRENADKIIGWYPIFDEEYRSVLNQKIVSHYLNYNIGYESASLFYFYITRKMNEIMPYYNQLYATIISPELINYTGNVDYYEQMGQTGRKISEDAHHVHSSTHDTSNSNSDEHGREVKKDFINGYVSANHEIGVNEENLNTGHSTSSGNTENRGKSNSEGSKSGNSNSDTKDSRSGTEHLEEDLWDKYSDTPQTNVQGITSNTYLTNLRFNDNEHNKSASDSGTSNTKGTTSEQYTDETLSNNMEETSGDTTNTETIIKTATNTDNYSDRNSHEDTGDSSRTSAIENHATSIMNKDENGNKNSEVNDTMNYLKHVWGRTNTLDVVNQLMKIREAIVNIDMLIIKDLHTLFFSMW